MFAGLCSEIEKDKKRLGDSDREQEMMARAEDVYERCIYHFCQQLPLPSYTLESYSVYFQNCSLIVHYSQFVMVCIWEGVRPTDLRLHLMKEHSGMPSSLKKEPFPASSSPDSVGASSSGMAKEQCWWYTPLGV
uniref:Uncharacterized protein n=1 Tax=Ananas comosus var. bracteatus TaxID=296719 RepID=A0A6V7Q9G5_ANACO|nr:unnamed protein product [Ananas comosus var. bracteatus]